MLLEKQNIQDSTNKKTDITYKCNKLLSRKWKSNVIYELPRKFKSTIDKLKENKAIIQRLQEHIIYASKPSWCQNIYYSNHIQKRYKENARERDYLDFPQEIRDIFRQNREWNTRNRLQTVLKRQTIRNRKRQNVRTFLKKSRVFFKKTQN